MADLQQKNSGYGDIEVAMESYLLSKSKADLHNVVQAGSRLVHYFAQLYAPGGRNDDVVQAGYEGLLKAAARYDKDRGVSFSTYASHYVMGEMRHFIRQEASFDRPGWVADLQNRVNRVIESQLQKTGELPSISHIASVLNVREEGVVQAMRAGWVSIDEIDLAKIHSQRYESFCLPIEDRIALKLALDKLSQIQRKVIGLLFFYGLTQTETAEMLGISQRKVSRLLSKSLALMARVMS